ncbi:2OG-Fe(II) oxygenase, partial [Streptomyces sp. NPDC056154]|uniref:2OG-Fe(II) oxygenase n=1 Tax=Streptomyces sp. NPDC056154 TaxID=3345729 RepID=UPI0035DB0176
MDKNISERIASLDWNNLQRGLDEQGFAVFPPILDANECFGILDAYEDEALYRKTIDMKRYRFGIGEYKYYEAPLPARLQQLREGFYPELAKAANRWLNQLGKEKRYPDSFQDFLEECHEAGQ